MQKTLLLILALLLCSGLAIAKGKKIKNIKSTSKLETVDKTIKEEIITLDTIVEKMEPKISTPKTTYVVIETTVGNIKIKLFNETPLHKANFIKIIQDGVLDSTLFHRVIPEFMIQGGDPLSKNAVPGQRLGTGGLDYRVPAELFPNIIHQKGALAAARDGNPQKASSSTQFYIVVGKTYTDNELNILGSRTGNSWTEAQKEIYKTIGGTPMLDMQYTVFGQTVEGQDIVDKIVSAPRDPYDRPFNDIRMLKVSVIEE